MHCRTVKLTASLPRVKSFTFTHSSNLFNLFPVVARFPSSSLCFHLSSSFFSTQSTLKMSHPPAAAAAASAPSKEKKKGQEKFVDTTKPKFVNATPAGQLKDFSVKMADAYHPDEVESAWDSWWEGQNLYKPVEDPTKEKFVMVIPPPNVTGTLHIGHALTCSLEDAITRWNRMSGKDTLWVPGTDHAGIATQVVVEKKLMREQQKTRHDLGREAFLEEVWKWKQQSGNRIYTQFRRLGASVDWSRDAFTMDEQRSRAVQEAFLRLHQKKLIYRSNRLVNWSCALRTAISNVEVDHLDLEGSTMLKVPGHAAPVEFGVIHSFAYKLEDGSGELIVATTRIETMLGDVAVAVHPDDERYKAFHGKTLKHPFLPDRKVVVITDAELVDMKFGTGAVKITPAHDPNDYKCGQRHKLPFINIFTDDGLINSAGGKFAGLKRFEVRTLIIEELKQLGVYHGKANNKMALGLCSRSKDIIEPVIRPQWYVDCGGMAKRAVQKVESGELTIVPSFHVNTWYGWLNNIQDWCISRQLWWGHRIPAYHAVFAGEEKEPVDDDDHWFTGASEADARAAAQAKFPDRQIVSLTQDPDVLDTWFSSGLFPFSTMGWPDKTKDLDAFYPGTLLETGHDILFFWVARMVMMGLELTDDLPFKKIYLHAMIRDKFGRKMSKSLGNVVDPIDVIEGITLEELQEKLKLGNLDPAELVRATEGQKKDFPDGIAQCGADALRFGLLAYTSQGRDINLDIQRVVAYRQFCNKLWQATRFALLNFEESFVPPASLDAVDELVKASGHLSARWILSRLHYAVNKCDSSFANYEFSDVTTAIYNFWLYDLCDVYLELIKPIVRLPENPTELDKTRKAAALAVLYTCLDHGLRLLHPIMPFITEELYHRLPGADSTPEKKAGIGGRDKCGSIMVQPYPKADTTARFHSPQAESDMDFCKEISHAVRSTRASLGLTKQKLDMYVSCATPELFNIVDANGQVIGVMSIANKVVALASSDKAPSGSLCNVVNPQVEVHIPLAGLVDVGQEVVKMEKTALRLEEVVATMKAKISAKGYEKTVADVQQKNAEKLAADTEELRKVLASIENFKSLMTPEQHTKYINDKKAALQAEADKLNKKVEELKKNLPPEPEKHPKKTLQKIAEHEDELKAVLARLEKL